MTLILRLGHDDGGSPAAAKELGEGTLTIGRGAGCDWVLDDPERTLSKLHCRIDSSADGYLLTDLSTNGVFLNGEPQPVGRGHARVLADGDEIALGPYTVAVGIAQPAPAPLPFAPELDPEQPGRLATPYNGVPQTPGSPIEPFPEEPWLQAIPTGDFGPGLRAQPIGWEAPPDLAGYAATGDRPPLSAHEPDRPLMPPLPRQDSDFAHQSEHLSAMATLMRTPAPQVTLPLDWNDTDPLGGIEKAPSHLAADILSPPPAPMLPASILPPAMAPAAAPEPAPAVPPAPSPGTHAIAPPDGWDGEPFLAGFAEAAGLGADCLAGMDHRTAGRELGRLVAGAIEGVRDVLATRAMVKSELRVDQTIVQAANNNALKFAPDVQRCLAAMVGQPPTGFLPGSAAMAQGLDDIKRHELALVAALNSVFNELTAALDPETIRAQVRSEAGVGSALPMVREARCWAVFEESYRALQGASGVQNTGGSLLALLATAYAKQVRRVP